MFHKGEEKVAAEVLTHFWSTVEGSKLFENWDFGIIEGLFFKSGMFNTAPQRKTTQQFLDTYGGFKRKITIGVTDLNTGNKTEI